MKLIDNKNYFLIDEVFPDNVIAGFTTREFKGDLQSGCLRQLPCLDGSYDLSFMNQIHSSTINLVVHAGIYQGDGIFTDCFNHILAVKTADCLPLLLFDPLKRSIGAIHMGWRSAHLGIVEAIQGNLKETFVFAGIGLRQCCYAVGQEFESYKNMSPYISRRCGKLYFDPVAFARGILAAKGMQIKNFYDLNLCSFCAQTGFSYRKDATASRNISFIVRRRCLTG